MEFCSRVILTVLPAHTGHPQPVLISRDEIGMKSHRASFAQLFKSGKYQELFNRLFISSSESVPVFQAFKHNNSRLLSLTHRGPCLFLRW